MRTHTHDFSCLTDRHKKSVTHIIRIENYLNALTEVVNVCVCVCVCVGLGRLSKTKLSM